MPIELRILSGARNGHTETFEKSVISIGRHPMSDFTFDPRQDLDVSTRHGEIRLFTGKYTIFDSNSTNGTFVNGERVPRGGSRELHDKDVITFGEQGPRVAVRLTGPVVPSPLARKRPPEPKAPTPPASAPPPPPPAAVGASAAAMVATLPPRRTTGERVAQAVREQTRTLRIGVGAALLLLVGLAGTIFYRSSRDSAVRGAEIQRLLANNEQMTKDFQARMAGDTAFVNSLQRHNDSLTKALREAKGAPEVTLARKELQRSHDLQQRFSEMELPALQKANDPGVVLISTVIAGQEYEATGFAISPSGLIVTNRHVVIDSTGRATKITVKFANTSVALRARVAKLSDDPTIDLALLQIEGAGGPFQYVTRIATSVDAPVGASIATIGFPLGSDVPMDGSAVNTTLTVGTISKSVPDVLQIDAFASHGSSGSPVFDGHGHVIGVVYGGARDGNGRVVYAIPAERITELRRGVK